MNISDLLTVGLATFAVTFLLKYIDGPFDVFAKLRQLLGPNLGFFGKLFDCFWCLGFWIGIVMLLLYISIPWVVYAFCVLGIIGYMHERIAE